MSTQAIALRQQADIAVPRTADEYNKLGKVLAESGYFTDAKSAAQAVVKVMAGAELGIPPIASMMGIHIVSGKAVLGGNLIASRIKAHGYDYRIKRLDNAGCTLVLFGRVGADGKRETLGESTFTEDDAKAAGVFSSNPNYRKYARNMYFNRAVSNAAKWFVPDVLSGLPVYTGEELGVPVDEQGDVVFTQAQPVVIEDAPKAAAPGPVPVAKTEPQALTSDEGDFVAKFREADKYGRLNCFATLKKIYSDLLGKDEGEARYYDHLAACSVKHANEFKSLKDALQCVLAMFRDCNALQVRKFAGSDVTPDESDAREDWVPDNIGGDAK